MNWHWPALTRVCQHYIRFEMTKLEDIFRLVAQIVGGAPDNH